MTNNEINLRDVPLGELEGELRRRGIEHVSRPTWIGSPSDRLRVIALLIIGVITGVLIVIVGMLSFTGRAIPDLVSGLTGSGLGALAGILSGQSSGSAAEGSTPTPTQP